MNIQKLNNRWCAIFPVRRGMVVRAYCQLTQLYQSTEPARGGFYQQKFI